MRHFESISTVTEDGLLAPRTNIAANRHEWGISRRMAEKVAKVDPLTEDEFVLWAAIVAVLFFLFVGKAFCWF